MQASKIVIALVLAGVLLSGVTADAKKKGEKTGPNGTMVVENATIVTGQPVDCELVYYMNGPWCRWFEKNGVSYLIPLGAHKETLEAIQNLSERTNTLNQMLALNSGFLEKLVRDGVVAKVPSGKTLPVALSEDDRAILRNIGSNIKILPPPWYESVEFWGPIVGGVVAAVLGGTIYAIVEAQPNTIRIGSNLD